MLGYRALPVLISARKVRLAAVAICALACCPSPAESQTPAGPIVIGSVAAAAANGGAKVSVAGSAGYRFNRAFGMGVELTWTNLRYGPEPDVFGSTTVSYGDPALDALFFTTNVRVEIPNIFRRVLPYATAGGGVVSTTTRYTVTKIGRAHV